MITAQRDRFKKLNTQLSQELSETHKAVTSLRAEIASLQKDNLNLYEKTRYINSYNRPGAGSSAIAEGTNASTVSFNSAPQLEQYRSTYESNVNPFAQFRGRESARAYKGMSLPERMVFSITRLVLATRTTRNLFAAYCVILHLLVFMSLYWAGMGGDHAISKVAVGGLKAASDAAQAKKDSLWDA
jgi:homeobox protein cut-like